MKTFLYIFWLLAIGAFVFFSHSIPADWMYNYGFIAGTVCLGLYQLAKECDN